MRPLFHLANAVFAFIAGCQLTFAAMPDTAERTPITAECMAHVSREYGIHADVLFAILLVERGTVGRNSRANQNGTYDIGPFQINSMHVDKLESMGITEPELRNNGCLNAAVAAWHLRKVLTPEVLSGVQDEESYLRAIALYHSRTPEYNQRYANRLREAFQTLYRDDQP